MMSLVDLLQAGAAGCACAGDVMTFLHSEDDMGENFSWMNRSALYHNQVPHFLRIKLCGILYGRGPSAFPSSGRTKRAPFIL
ncbi:hypothetical protein V6N13_076800 [Hibiscus sabdariffa]